MNDRQLVEAISVHIRPMTLDVTARCRRITGRMPTNNADHPELELEGWRWPDGSIVVLDSAGQVWVSEPMSDGGEPLVTLVVNGHVLHRERGTFGAYMGGG